METKVCKKCRATKEFKDFSKNKNCKYGVTNFCKKCLNENRNKEYQKKYREENRVKFAAYNKKYASTEKGETTKDRWIINNYEKVNEIKRRWAEKNKDKRKEISASSSRRRVKYNVVNLTDKYIIEQIEKTTPLTRIEIKNNPSLISAKREIIKLNRLIKNHGKK